MLFYLPSCSTSHSIDQYRQKVCKLLVCYKIAGAFIGFSSINYNDSVQLPSSSVPATQTSEVLKEL